MPEEVQTLQLEATGITGEYFKVEVINAKEVNPGIFSSKYSAYTIKTNPKGWVVDRKFSRFAELRAHLLGMYPGFIIPPLPAKPEDKLKPADMERRRKCFELFLNDILKHPVLRSCSLVHLFLSIPKDKEYEEKRSLYSKLPFPKEVTDYRTLNGVARVGYDKELMAYCGALGTANSKIQELHKEYFFR